MDVPLSSNAVASLPNHPWLRDRFGLWIEGREQVDGDTFPITSPYWNLKVAEVTAASAVQVAQAIEVASNASRQMRALSRHERASILRRAAALLAENKELFARVITAESSKPLRESLIETDRAFQTLSVSADEALRLAGDVVPMDAAPNGKGYLGFTLREPLGVVAAITPFNFPLNLSLHKIGPALAAGNAVVHKPSSATPLTALLLARLLHEAGLPAGALNTVPGSGSEVGKVLSSHPSVAMITFTGSPEVGMALRQQAGAKRVTLELGSNSAVVVMPDVVIDDTARRCVAGAYAHSGQVCISVQRIYVHRDVFPNFLEHFTASAAALKTGAPEDPATELSCVINPMEARRIVEWVEEAKGMGARLETGGWADGARVAATVVTHVPEDAKVIRCEAFGPVACVNPVDSLDDAIAAVNRSDFGLQAGIFTNHAPSAWRAAQEIHTGAVLINETPQFRADHMPYGGVKQSGVGREGPHYAIEEMTEPKLIVWRL
jgi:acyl-CoA reductase-like NAD-dependent aldehyde dehydrogenase